jgi:hypothetical protein
MLNDVQFGGCTTAVSLRTNRSAVAHSAVQDIAIVTGAEFVAKDLGMKVETTGPESLGIARKVSCSELPEFACCKLSIPWSSQGKHLVPSAKEVPGSGLLCRCAPTDRYFMARD